MEKPDSEQEHKEGKTVRLSFVKPGKRAFREEFLGGKLEVLSSRGVRGPERALIEALDGDFSGRVLVAGTREAIIALAASALHPQARVHWLAFDAYELHRTAERLKGFPRENLEVFLGADLPATGAYDWVILALPHTGDAMLTAELVWEAGLALSRRGKLLAATDNPRDRWLHERIREAFGAATIHRRSRRGTVYVARKQTGWERTPKAFRRSFRARVFGREVEIETRPGIFSHGELDEGTLALTEVATLRAACRLLDLGCGSGVVGIAGALASGGWSLLVDSSVRAVQVSAANARRNGAERSAAVLLAHDLSPVAEASMDLVLTNPPYYADYRIAHQFARDAHRTLKPGGEFLLVTKTPEMPEAIIGRVFGRCERLSRRGYWILKARR